MSVESYLTYFAVALCTLLRITVQFALNHSVCVCVLWLTVEMPLNL